jgi:hypothetical protein
VKSGLGTPLALGANLQSGTGDRNDFTGIQTWIKLWPQQEKRAPSLGKKQFNDAELLAKFP